MMKYLVYLGVPLLLMMTSCKSKQDINYMTNIENVAIEASQRQYASTIQASDQLSITVLAKDNEVAKPLQPELLFYRCNSVFYNAYA